MKLVFASITLVALSVTSVAQAQSRVNKEQAVEAKMHEILGVAPSSNIFLQGTGTRKNSAGKSVVVKCFATYNTGSFTYGTEKDLLLTSEKYYQSASNYLADGLDVPQYSKFHEEYLLPYNLSVDSKTDALTVQRSFKSGLTKTHFVLKMAKDAAGLVSIQVQQSKTVAGFQKSVGENRLNQFKCQGMKSISLEDYLSGQNSIVR